MSELCAFVFSGYTKVVFGCKLLCSSSVGSYFHGTPNVDCTDACSFEYFIFQYFRMIKV